MVFFSSSKIIFSSVHKQSHRTKKSAAINVQTIVSYQFFVKLISGLVYEHVLGENKFTFVEECRNPQSVTILLKAPNKHSLTQMKVRFHEFSRRFAIFFFFAKKRCCFVYGLCENAVLFMD